MDRRLTIRFTGSVQGVGFRYTALRLASRWPAVTGTVRNASDGSVELVVEGPAGNLAALADAIQDSMAGYIRGAEQRYSEASGGFRGFRIVH